MNKDKKNIFQKIEFTTSPTLDKVEFDKNIGEFLITQRQDRFINFNSFNFLTENIQKSLSKENSDEKSLELTKSIEEEKSYNDLMPVALNSEKPELLFLFKYGFLFNSSSDSLIFSNREDHEKFFTNEGEYFNLQLNSRLIRFKRIKNLISKFNKISPFKKAILEIAGNIKTKIEEAKDEVSFFSSFFQKLDILENLFDVDNFIIDKFMAAQEKNKTLSNKKIRNIFEDLRFNLENYDSYDNSKKIAQFLAMLRIIMKYQSDFIFDFTDDNISFLEEEASVASSSKASQIYKKIYDVDQNLDNFEKMDFYNRFNSSLNVFANTLNKRISFSSIFLSKHIRYSKALLDGIPISNFVLDKPNSGDIFDKIIGKTRGSYLKIEPTENNKSLMEDVFKTDSEKNNILPFEKNDTIKKGKNYLSGYSYYLSSMANSKSFLSPARLESFTKNLEKKYNIAVDILRDITFLNKEKAERIDKKYYSDGIFRESLDSLYSFLDWNNENFESSLKLLLCFRLAKDNQSFRKLLIRYFVYSAVGYYRNQEGIDTNRFFKLIQDKWGDKYEQDAALVVKDLDKMFGEKFNLKLTSSNSSSGDTNILSLYKYKNTNLFLDIEDLLFREKQKYLSAVNDPFRNIAHKLELVLEDLDAIAEENSLLYENIKLENIATLYFDNFLSIIDLMDIDLFFGVKSEDKIGSVEIDLGKLILTREAVGSIINQDKNFKPTYKDIQNQLKLIVTSLENKQNSDLQSNFINYYTEIRSIYGSIDSSLSQEDLFVDQMLAFLETFKDEWIENYKGFLNFLAPDGPNRDVLELIQNDFAKLDKLRGISRRQVEYSNFQLNEIDNLLNTEDGKNEFIKFAFLNNIPTSENQAEKILNLLKIFETNLKNPRVIGVGIPRHLTRSLLRKSNSKNKDETLIKINVHYTNELYENVHFHPSSFIFDLSNMISDVEFDNINLESFKFNFDEFLKNSEFFKRADLNKVSSESGRGLLTQYSDKNISSTELNSILTNHFFDFLMKKFLKIRLGASFQEEQFLIYDKTNKTQSIDRFLNLLNLVFIESGKSLEDFNNFINTDEEVIFLLEKLKNNFQITNRTVTRFTNPTVTNELSEDFIDLYKVFRNYDINTEGESLKSKVVFPKAFDRFFIIPFQVVNTKVDKEKSDISVLKNLESQGVLIRNEDQDLILAEEFSRSNNLLFEKYYLQVEFV